jgi:hypothetical protein
VGTDQLEASRISLAWPAGTYAISTCIYTQNIIICAHMFMKIHELLAVPAIAFVAQICKMRLTTPIFVLQSCMMQFKNDL